MLPAEKEKPNMAGAHEARKEGSSQIRQSRNYHIRAFGLFYGEKTKAMGKFAPKRRDTKSYQFIKWCLMTCKQCEHRYFMVVSVP